MSAKSRAAALLAWADRLEGAAEALARTITTATGKPIRALPLTTQGIKMA